MSYYYEIQLTGILVDSLLEVVSTDNKILIDYWILFWFMPSKRWLRSLEKMEKDKISVAVVGLGFGAEFVPIYLERFNYNFKMQKTF